MFILLVVLWLLGVLARGNLLSDDSRKDTNYVIKREPSCPAVGYFFRREASPNALSGRVCHLCFCQNDGTAVCWQRENRRCDAAHYKHGTEKRDTRVRRSPIGFSDIFFRDAARDIFDKQTPETCKPFESSFSEGCPPADWCTGCTVCDCDANGRWDCHILSFCPDKKDKTKLKTKKKRLGDIESPRRTTHRPITTTKRTPPKRTTLIKKTAINTSKPVIKNAKNITRRASNPSKNNKQIIKNVKKGNNTIQKKNKASPKPLIIKKETTSQKKAVERPKNSRNLDWAESDTDKITQEVYKKVVSAMQTFLAKRTTTAKVKPTVKTMQKRSMVKRSAKNLKNTKNAKRKVNGHFKPAANKKQMVKPSGPKNNKQKSINNSKTKSLKKGVTTKKPNKPQITNGKRTKRDASNNITETVVITNSTYKNTESSSIILPITKLTESDTNVVETSNYYKYTVIPMFKSNLEEYTIINNITNTTTDNNTMKHEHNKRDKENRFDEIQAIVLNSTTLNAKNVTILEKTKMSVETALPDFNDLKFSDWHQMKMLKNSLLIRKLVNSTKIVNKNGYNPSNYSEVPTTRKNIKTKDVARIVSGPFRKYNRSKIINTLSCNTIHSPKRMPENFRQRIYRKIDDLQNILRRVLGEFHKKNTTTIRPKPKRFNIIKYLKRFFNNIFKKNKNKTKYTSNEQIEFNNHIIDSICENFINCDMSKRKSIILKFKLRDLNRESFNIIRTIKIIKGLLHLVDLPNVNPISDDNIKPNLKKDIHKLNAILKDKYLNNDSSLTSTQVTQITYIKNNTQSFVQSVGRFANILNEIITILTTKQNIAVKSKLKLKTVKRSYENNRKVKNDTSDDFKQLKGLLVKYNLIQNTFVRKMYNVLSKFEKVHDTNNKVNETGENKVTTATIDRFSGNIISNLRKLRNLAQILNSRRPKRNTMADEDAIEYLLTLMEYLLKQNYPLDAAPVNDGIDLLIDAIKSAPDIKPIKKKVLQLPVNVRISRTTEPVPLSILKEESSFDSVKDDDSNINDTRSDTGEHSSDVEVEKEENFKFDPRPNIFGAAGNTEVYYVKDNSKMNSNQLTTSPIPNHGIYGVIEETSEHNNFKKFEYIAKETKKFELFNSDDDDEVEVTSTTLAADTETDTETETTVRVTAPLETIAYNKPASAKPKQYSVNSIDVSGNSEGEKRIGLDWLDEGYDDNKELRQTKSVSTTQTAAPVTTTMKAVAVDNVSTITKEVSDEEERKRRAKINAEDVMLRKQMDLLNSLDYGTERSDADDDSKEGDERYSGDAFPSYFA